nr:hypothetical protein Iba_chr08bCG12890 [Ipomoea batatas]
MMELSKPLSSYVAAVGFPLALQFSPEADHLLRRLIVCGVIVFDASELAELQAVYILHRPRIVELLYPHSHAHILHLEQLQLMLLKIRDDGLCNVRRDDITRPIRVGRIIFFWPFLQLPRTKTISQWLMVVIDVSNIQASAMTNFLNFIHDSIYPYKCVIVTLHYIL